MISIKKISALLAAAAVIAAGVAYAGGINGPGPILVAILNMGGNNAALNVTATGVVKATPGVVFRIIPTTVGTGTLTLNNSATTGAAATANIIDSIPAASMTAGVPITLEAPFTNGLVVSAITSGGVFTITYN
jgi:hypothetical protein